MSPFGGKDIFEMSEFYRKNDPTRLVHYEGVFHDRSYNATSDMESQMYPSVEAIKEFLAKDDSKPFISASIHMQWEIPVVPCTNTRI